MRDWAVSNKTPFSQSALPLDLWFHQLYKELALSRERLIPELHHSIFQKKKSSKIEECNLLSIIQPVVYGYHQDPRTDSSRTDPKHDRTGMCWGSSLAEAMCASSGLLYPLCCRTSAVCLGRWPLCLFYLQFLLKCTLFHEVLCYSSSWNDFSSLSFHSPFSTLNSFWLLLVIKSVASTAHQGFKARDWILFIFK